LAQNNKNGAAQWRVVIVGGHTRSIGKTQLVCDVIAAFPRTNWIAGKITQYWHGVCARNGEDCDCAPEEHVCAMEWETSTDSGTDSARFLAAGAKRSFWLRTKQGYLAEGLPLLRGALEAVINEMPAESSAVIIESNSLMQFMKPSLYLAVVDPAREDFKESARAALDRADALVLRGTMDLGAAMGPVWTKLPAKLLREKPSATQREGEALPEVVQVLVQRVLEAPAAIRI
jgi:molybdopterin-guanine dinucleotide biosynthesis protein